MTPEDQRIAIAQALGIKQIIMFQGEPWYSLRGDGKPNRPVPDYLNDLNSCHEMENALEPRFQVVEYGIEVLKVIERSECISVDGEPCWGKLIHATAAQRCEAFLKTLGLWKETNHE